MNLHSLSESVSELLEYGRINVREKKATPHDIHHVLRRSEVNADIFSLREEPFK